MKHFHDFTIFLLGCKDNFESKLGGKITTKLSKYAQNVNNETFEVKSSINLPEFN